MKLENFVKKRDFLICVDSDGCAMDTMDVKHIRCFGPCLVEEWRLGEFREEILARWNEINLYTGTRGINRFKGLSAMLKEIDSHYGPVEDLASLERWVKESDELSNAALSRAIEETDSVCLRKALSWSNRTNAAIDALTESDKKPFDGVQAALEYMHARADLAVVSSANLQAVEEEWERCGLLSHVDVVCAQDAGSKAFCIGELLKRGYDRSHVLMVGDAPGDLAAAEENGVFFYPILVKGEAASWRECRSTAVDRLFGGTYDMYQNEKIDAFKRNLE